MTVYLCEKTLCNISVVWNRCRSQEDRLHYHLCLEFRIFNIKINLHMKLFSATNLYTGKSTSTFR